MQYKKINVFFWTLLPICTLLRYFQYKFIIDSSNGFFMSENRIFGVVTTAVLFIAAVCIGIFSYLNHRLPENTPTPNTVLSIFSFLAAAAVFTDAFLTKVSVSQNPFLSVLKIIFALLSIIFFVSFGAKKFIKIVIPSVCYLFPCAFMLVKLICEFSVISSVAVIADNIFILAAYCSVMVFFLQFSKLYNNEDTETNFKKLLSSSLVSVFFSITQSVAYLVYNIPTTFENTHTPLSSNIFLLFMGLFIYIFTYFHFSENNFVRKH